MMREDRRIMEILTRVIVLVPPTSLNLTTIHEKYEQYLLASDQEKKEGTSSGTPWSKSVYIAQAHGLIITRYIHGASRF